MGPRMYVCTSSNFQTNMGFKDAELRSTVDSLARLDDYIIYIKIAFARKQHVVAVFFDLEKAYDT